jgi:hypothetical protein
MSPPRAPTLLTDEAAPPLPRLRPRPPLSVAQVAARVGSSTRTVVRLASSGAFPGAFQRVPRGSWLVPSEGLEAFLVQRRSAAVAVVAVSDVSENLPSGPCQVRDPVRTPCEAGVEAETSHSHSDRVGGRPEPT